MNHSHAPAIIPEPTARSAVRRGLLIPHGYLHPGKCEHSEVQQLGNLSEHARVESAWGAWKLRVGCGKFKNQNKP